MRGVLETATGGLILILFLFTDAVAKEEASAPARPAASSSRARQSADDRYGDDEDDRRYEGEGIVADDDEY